MTSRPSAPNHGRLQELEHGISPHYPTTWIAVSSFQHSTVPTYNHRWENFHSCKEIRKHFPIFNVSYSPSPHCCVDTWPVILVVVDSLRRGGRHRRRCPGTAIRLIRRLHGTGGGAEVASREGEPRAKRCGLPTGDASAGTCVVA